MADGLGEAVVMDNSGQGPLQVPGFGRTSIYHELSMEDCFAEDLSGWLQDPALTVPEMAMLQLMSDLTDKDKWHTDIFNDEVVAKWREEVFAENTRIPKESMRRISMRAWDWCLAELRDKASKFQEDQFVRLLDAGSSACKSDTLVPESLRIALKDGTAPVLEESRAHQDHIQSQVLLELVDPMLFPLIYDKTLVLTNGGQVDLLNCFESYWRGELSLLQLNKPKDVLEVRSNIERRTWGTFHKSIEEMRSYRWSETYQMLPCEVKFEGLGVDVQITSYINNLHPDRYKPLYRSIEKLISAAIKPWNECLIKGEKGRWPMRIRTFGLTWEPHYPQSLIDALKKNYGTEAFNDAMKEAERFLRLPDCGFTLPDRPSSEPTELPEEWDESVQSTTSVRHGEPSVPNRRFEIFPTRTVVWVGNIKETA